MPCGFGSNINRIAPEPGPFEGYELVEIRPKRKLRILHLNESPREEKWIQESEKHARIRQFFEKAGSIDRHVFEGKEGMSTPTSTKSKMQNNVESSRENFAKAKENGAPRTMQDYVLNERDAIGSSEIKASFPGETSDWKEGRSSSTSQEFRNSPSNVSNKSDHSHDFLPQSLGKHVRLRLDVQSEDRSGSSCGGQIIPNENTVIFFFHGVGGSSDMWRAQLDYFSGLGYEVVVPDLVGHGLSMAPDEPGAYEFKEIMWDLVAVFDRYFKKQNVIIGHSYGSCFATVVSRMRPRRVSKLVLISGGGPTPLAPQPGIFSLPVCMLECIKPFLVCSFRRNAFTAKNRNQIAGEQAFDIPTYVFRYIMRGQDWLDGDEVFHRLLNVATLLVYGAKDQLVSLEDEQDMEKCIAGSKLEVVEDASHMVMIESPDKVNSLIYNFLLEDITVENYQLVMHSQPIVSARSRKSLPDLGSIVF